MVSSHVRGMLRSDRLIKLSLSAVGVLSCAFVLVSSIPYGITQAHIHVANDNECVRNPSECPLPVSLVEPELDQHIRAGQTVQFTFSARPTSEQIKEARKEDPNTIEFQTGFAFSPEDGLKNVKIQRVDEQESIQPLSCSDTSFPQADICAQFKEELPKERTTNLAFNFAFTGAPTSKVIGHEVQFTGFAKIVQTENQGQRKGGIVITAPPVTPPAPPSKGVSHVAPPVTPPAPSAAAPSAPSAAAPSAAAPSAAVPPSAVPPGVVPPSAMPVKRPPSMPPTGSDPNAAPQS